MGSSQHGLYAQPWGNGFRASTPIDPSSQHNFAQLAAGVARSGKGASGSSQVTMIANSQTGYSEAWVHPPIQGGSSSRG